MQHIFILFDGIPGEESDALGVFSTLDAAETGVPEDVEDYYIEEWELDGDHVETHVYGSEDEEE